MKKIFILKGVSNTGKTSKINMIATWVLENYNVSNQHNIDITDIKIDISGVLTIGNLTIAFNSGGDDEGQILKVDKLVLEFNVDIVICACRTKGITYQHLYKNYIRPKGWLDTYINVEELNKNDKIGQSNRDSRIIAELKTWLIGLEKM